MNAWDVDPNLQLSTYTEMGHKIVLLFNKLWYGLVSRFALVRLPPRLKKPQAVESPTRGQMSYCCTTPFKELAENHRLYYPTPHIF